MGCEVAPLDRIEALIIAYVFLRLGEREPTLLEVGG